jgi:hypothetical protein
MEYLMWKKIKVLLLVYLSKFPYITFIVVDDVNYYLP